METLTQDKDQLVLANILCIVRFPVLPPVKFNLLILFLLQISTHRSIVLLRAISDTFQSGAPVIFATSIVTAWLSLSVSKHSSTYIPILYSPHKVALQRRSKHFQVSTEIGHINLTFSGYDLIKNYSSSSPFPLLNSFTVYFILF